VNSAQALRRDAGALAKSQVQREASCGSMFSRFVSDVFEMYEAPACRSICEAMLLATLSILAAHAPDRPIFSRYYLIPGLNHRRARAALRFVDQLIAFWDWTPLAKRLIIRRHHDGMRALLAVRSA